jgi:hypothetical protein
MSELLDLVLRSHGGLDRWNKFHKITATIVGGGGLWPLKGIDLDPGPREMSVMLHEEWASVSPFGQPDWRSVFRPSRVTIETVHGAVVQERRDPRASFTGHVMNTSWDPLHLAYFNGYAMWTYLTTPFFMAMPGFTVAEIAPWQEGNALWRGLRVRFPDDIASHSQEQDFYFDDDFLLRRHDYQVDVAGGFPAAQYVHDFVEVEGLRYPTKRFAYVRGPNLKPIRDLLLVSINLSNFRFNN